MIGRRKPPRESAWGETERRRDGELVRLAQARGREGKKAFGELAARHQAWLVRLLRYYTLGSQAEDIAQDALVRAYTSLDRCPRGEGFRAWLRTIATRLAYNHYRDQKTRSRNELAAARERSSEISGNFSALGRREAIERVLGQLPYAAREVLILRYVEELSVQEVAKELQLGVSAAKMRLVRARADFDRIYRGETGDGET